MNLHLNFLSDFYELLNRESRLIWSHQTNDNNNQWYLIINL